MHIIQIETAPGANEIPPCGTMTDREGSCLVLSLRHLGDAVIGSGLINALRKNNPKLAIDVLGPTNLQEVVTTFSTIRDFIGANVPLFGHHRKGFSASWQLLETLRLVRKRRYEFCINLIGDVRENAIGLVTGAKWNIAPVWESGHLFKYKMTDRGAQWLTNCGIRIPSSYSSFYDSMEHFANLLGLPRLEWPRIRNRNGKTGNRKTVAIHPGASHVSRRWPQEKWRAVTGALLAQGFEVKILGADFEREALSATFERELGDQSIEIVTGDIRCFVSALSAADLLVGMDSFSVHAAHALGVPTIVLNGSADPSILTPPEGRAISAGGLCEHYPCYYSYPCRGSKSEYICTRGIEATTVQDAVTLALADQPVSGLDSIAKTNFKGLE